MIEASNTEVTTTPGVTVRAFADEFDMSPQTVRDSIRAGNLRGVWLSQKLLQPHNCWTDCVSDNLTMTALIMDWIAAIEAAGGGTGEILTVDGITSDSLNIVDDGVIDLGSDRYTGNLIALWEFKDGSGAVARDTSGVAPAMDLRL